MECMRGGELSVWRGKRDTWRGGEWSVWRGGELSVWRGGYMERG